MTPRARLIFRILLLVYLAVVLVLCFGQFSSSPDIPKTLLGIPMDKVAHFLMFLPFPILCFLAFDRYTENLRSTLIFTSVTFAVGLLLALGTEWGQAHLTSYRDGNGWDFFADALALTLSSVFVLFWDLRKQKK